MSTLASGRDHILRDAGGLDTQHGHSGAPGDQTRTGGLRHLRHQVSLIPHLVAWRHPLTLIRCRAHLPLIPASSTLPGHLQSDSQPPSRTSSPQPSHPTALGIHSNGESSRHGGHAVGPEKGTGGNTGIGSGSGRMDASGNVFFDCLVCSRAVSRRRSIGSVTRLTWDGRYRRIGMLRIYPRVSA